MKNGLRESSWKGHTWKRYLWLWWGPVAGPQWMGGGSDGWQEGRWGAKHHQHGGTIQWWQSEYTCPADLQGQPCLPFPESSQQSGTGCPQVHTWARHICIRMIFLTGLELAFPKLCPNRFKEPDSTYHETTTPPQPFPSIKASTGTQGKWPCG